MVGLPKLILYSWAIIMMQSVANRPVVLAGHSETDGLRIRRLHASPQPWLRMALAQGRLAQARVALPGSISALKLKKGKQGKGKKGTKERTRKEKRAFVEIVKGTQ